MNQEIESDYDILKELETIKRKPDKPEPKATSERQYWIQKTATMLGVQFTTVLWKTITWPTPWIQENYANAMKNGKPPARLWNGLYKKAKQ